MRPERIVRELADAVPKAFAAGQPPARSPAAALRAARAWVEAHCLRRMPLAGRTRVRAGREEPLLRYLDVVERLAGDEDEATRELARGEALGPWLEDLLLQAGPATQALLLARR